MIFVAIGWLTEADMEVRAFRCGDTAALPNWARPAQQNF
jgi:hypothetical protein